MLSRLHGGLVFPGDEQKLSPGHEEEKKVEEEKISADDINKNFCPRISELSLEERYKLCLSIGEETLSEDRLMDLLKKKENFICYDGFEPSGRMHIAQGLLKAINVNKITKSGGIFVFWVADWFAMLNKKMDGDLKKIQDLGRYFIEIWKAVGMNLENVKFLWASDEINKRAEEYWSMVMDISTKNTLNRILRCTQIMGRTGDYELSASQIFYPCMQATDIFFLKADVCQLGMDQRKVNVLAIEYAEKEGLTKPVVISHPMLMGLKKGQEKMSKSDPDSAIFMEDTAKDVERKIKKAYCEPQVVEGNPILNYVKHIIFGMQDSWVIERPEQWGGNITYNNYEELEKSFADGILSPEDLKFNLIKIVNKMLEPVRQHFENDPFAKSLLEKVKEYRK